MKKLEETIEQIEQLLSKLFSYRLFWILSIIAVVIILFLVCYFWVFAPDFLNLTKEQQQARELHSGLIRNRAWILWMLASFTGLTIGLWLTNRGRKTQEKQWQTQKRQSDIQEKQSDIQHKADLHERLEKAIAMLENEAMSTRIIACRLLTRLGNDDPSMKSLCVHLLFDFIKNPYLKPDDKNKKTDGLFSDSNDVLRADIQEAADSFSNIYEHYGDEGIDDKLIQLPNYFLINMDKNPISLIKANLKFTDFSEVFLPEANLQGTNLQEANFYCSNLEKANLQEAYLSNAEMQEIDLSGADLQEAILTGANLIDACLKDTILRGVNFDDANLHDTDLSGADLTGAEMEKAKNLTKEQILSAKCGFMEEGQKGGGWCSFPLLSSKFYNDPEVRKWQRKDHFNNEKKTS